MALLTLPAVGEIGNTIAAGLWKHTVGLKADGTVVAAGDNGYGQCNVSGWKNIRVPQR